MCAPGYLRTDRVRRQRVLPQKRHLLNRGRGLEFGKWEGSQGWAQSETALSRAGMQGLVS